MAASTFRPPRRKPTSAESFIEAAEAPAPPEAHQPLDDSSVAERAAGRSSAGPKFGFYTFRGSQGQRELLKYAAKKKGISQNELIARYVFEPLEAEFGEEVPF